MFNELSAVIEGTLAAMVSIRAHAMRSALTTLGIVIGVAAVVTVVAVMQGLSASINFQLNDLGSDMVTLRASTPEEQKMLGLENKLSYADFLVLKAKISEVHDMSVSMQPFSFGSRISFGRETIQTQIIGADSNYQKVIKIYPHKGRFTRSSDDDHRRRVVFIGESVRKKLKMPNNPVGEFISLNDEWFRVVGLAEERGSLFGFDQDNYIIAPFSTMASLNGSKVTDNVNIMFRPKQVNTLHMIEAQISKLLRKRHHLTGNDKDDFEFNTAKKTKESFDKVTNTVTFVAGGVVAISLLVGGIGVMNIMLVSVTERTKEIGINKALGATPNFIMLQFLVEALVLSLFGGLIGLALGWGLATFISLLMPNMPSAVVPMWAVALSFGFTFVIGIVFGLMPAVKASKLNPIDALRYE